MKEELYFKEAVAQIPRLLGLIDRNILSKTYGCFDREYWHYNTTDIPCARKQEAVLFLALAYKIKHKENPYYKNKKILVWVNAGVEFWAKIQSKSGSFSEWYPNENSFVATSFSSCAISETLILLGNEIKCRERIIFALKKSADWLKGKYESGVQNQQAGAALALLNVHILTKEKKYMYDSEKKVDSLITNQSKEGWWAEYGGPDIGYLSLTVDYLAKYYHKKSSNRLKNSIKDAIEFLSYFAHPDLTSGGVYGSRNTEYLIPSGFELMNGIVESAGTLSSFVRQSMKEKKSVSISSIDDRYLSYVGYNWLFAYFYSKQIKERGYKFNKCFSKNFEDAKIFIKSTPDIYFVLNYSKGTFKVFFKNKNKSYTDSGILVEDKGSHYLSGSIGSVESWIIEQDRIVLKGKFNKLSKSLLTPNKNIGFRVFLATLGSSEHIGFYVKKRLREKLISKPKSTEIKFIRQISIGVKSVKIKDKIIGVNRTAGMFSGGNFAYLYVPSANYFQVQDVLDIPAISERRTNNKRYIEITRDIK